MEVAHLVLNRRSHNNCHTKLRMLSKIAWSDIFGWVCILSQSASASALPTQDLAVPIAGDAGPSNAAYQLCYIDTIDENDREVMEARTGGGATPFPLPDAPLRYCLAKDDEQERSPTEDGSSNLESAVPAQSNSGEEHVRNSPEALTRRHLHGPHAMIEDNIPGLLTSITLINGTPFRLKRIYSSSYQAPAWDNWLEDIQPGQAFTVQVPNTAGPRGWYIEDTAAEVEYTLTGTDGTKSIRIEFKMEDHGEWRPEASLTWKFKQQTKPGCSNSELTHRMQHLPTPYGTSFLLAGSNESELLSTAEWDHRDADQQACPSGYRQNVAWMQQLLPEIGHLPLREIVLPRAHHASLRLSETESHWPGTEDNAVTQVATVSQLLRDSGVRVLDTRVARINGRFCAAHLVADMPVGVTGQGIVATANAINAFLEDHPGELIIWDFHDQSWSSERDFKRFNTTEKAELYEFLKRKVNNRVVLDDEEGDISKMPLKTFIGGGKSAVIIRFGHAWKAAGSRGFPGASEGFVHAGNFPVKSRWSDERDQGKLVRDQMQLLQTHRKTRDSPVFDLDWVLTLRVAENIYIPNGESLIDLGRQTMVPLRRTLWNSLTTSTYPSWITVDSIEGGELRSLVMAMNLCFAAALCGDWAEKPR